MEKQVEYTKSNPDEPIPPRLLRWYLRNILGILEEIKTELNTKKTWQDLEEEGLVVGDVKKEEEEH